MLPSFRYCSLTASRRLAVDPSFFPPSAAFARLSFLNRDFLQDSRRTRRDAIVCDFSSRCFLVSSTSFKPCSNSGTHESRLTSVLATSSRSLATDTSVWVRRTKEEMLERVLSIAERLIISFSFLETCPDVSLNQKYGSDCRWKFVGPVLSSSETGTGTCPAPKAAKSFPSRE